MNRRPRHPRPDANQARIAADLRAAGYAVVDVSSLAEVGFDLLVLGLRRGVPVWLAVECKTEGGRLTPRETEVYHAVLQAAGWYRLSAPYVVAYTAEDVTEWFGATQGSGEEAK